MSDLTSTIEELFERYQGLRQAGEAYSASVQLGEIINCIRQNGRSINDSEGWTARIAAVDLPIGDIAAISQGVQASLARIGHILGIGTKWEYEEILLIITLRVEVSMALEFLLFRGIDISEVDVSVADEPMDAYAATSDGKKLMREASRMAKRNWGFPMSHRWLDL